MSEHSKSQAKAQMGSVAELVEALELDWDRLEDLREQYTDEPEDYSIVKVVDDGDKWTYIDKNGNSTPRTYTTKQEAIFAAWIESEPDYNHKADIEELKELEKIAGDCESWEDAQQRIHEDALSVEVRSGWRTIGGESEPAEYRVVLCTG